MAEGGVTSCSVTHCVEVRGGLALAWATRPGGNRFGQLGRGTASSPATRPADYTPAPMTGLPPGRRVVAAAAGGGRDAGHTVVVDDLGGVWAAGCDRWQQLGLGSSHGGGTGYTWQGGRLWQPKLRRAGPFHAAGGGPSGAGGAGAAAGAAGEEPFFVGVACGADYTVAVTRRGVAWGWGRSHLGQASGGRTGPFVAGPKPLALPMASAASPTERALASPAGDCTVLVHDMARAAAAASSEGTARAGQGDGKAGGDDKDRPGDSQGQPGPASTFHGRCPADVLRSVLLGLGAVDRPEGTGAVPGVLPEQEGGISF